MTLLGRQVAGLLLAATGLVVATSASVMLMEPILAPQEVPETVQAAPSPAPGSPGTTPPDAGSQADLPTELAEESPQPPERDQTAVLDETILSDEPGAPDKPVAPDTSGLTDDTTLPDEAVVPDDTPDLPDVPTPTPPAAQDPADVVTEPRPEPAVDDAVTEPDPVPADDAVTQPDPVPAVDDVVDQELPDLPDAPADGLVHRDRPAAPDPRSTGRSAGPPDAAARPDRGKPVFPAGWPWHERLGNQGNGQGWGPPSRSG